jgi:hypothetical protein
MKHTLPLLVVYIGLAFTMQYLLPTDELLLDNLTQTVSLNKAEEVLAQMVKYRWVGYVLTPVLLLLKWLFVSSLLYTALFFANVKLGFKALWQITVQAEWVFVLAALVKFCWFYFFATNYTLQDLQFFYPLSAANLFSPAELEAWWVYPFQLINLFEVAYWLVLAVLLGKALQIKPGKAAEYVAKGYGTGLLLWVLLVVFITLNFSV